MPTDHGRPLRARVLPVVCVFLLLVTGCTPATDDGEASDNGGSGGDEEAREYSGPPAETPDELHAALTEALGISTVANWEFEWNMADDPRPSTSQFGRLSCDADGSGVYAQLPEPLHPENEDFSPEPHPEPPAEPDSLPEPEPAEYFPGSPLQGRPVSQGYLTEDEAYVPTDARTWMRVPVESLPPASFELLLDCSFFPAVALLSEDLERVDTEEVGDEELFVWEGNLDVAETAATDVDPNPFADAEFPGVSDDHTVRMWTDEVNLPRALYFENESSWRALVVHAWDEGEPVTTPPVGAVEE